MQSTVSSMDFELLQTAVNFHGNQLVEALQAEQGDSFASNVHVVNEPVECCTLSNDRRKALVSFIAQKADILFKRHKVNEVPNLKPDLDEKDYYAVMPPLECYMDFSEESRKIHFYESLGKGDIVIGIVSAKHTRGLIIELICVSVGKMRFIHDLNLKCFCNTHQIPVASAHEDPLEIFHAGDLIQGLVLDVQPEMEKIYISMKDSLLPPHLQHQQIKLGMITDDDLPNHHKQSIKLRGNEKYEETIENTLGFMNPLIVSHLSNMMGISLKRSESLMRGLHTRKEYAKEDFGTEIYKVQCAKWAYKSVKQGVQYFKAGNTVEAFQCLNKALQIDPLNVEALVARGALYANNNSFSRAIEDFNKALELNPQHVNAGKFVVETLVAFGKQLEEQSCTDEAIKCYQKALLLNPNHSEAMYYMKSSQKKAARLEKEKARQLTQDAEAMNKKHAMKEEQAVSGTKQKLKQLLNLEKEGKSISKKRRHSSSSSLSSSPSSSSSISSSSSSSSTSCLDSNNSSLPESTQSRKGKTRIITISSSSQSDSPASIGSGSPQHHRRNLDGKNRRSVSKRRSESKSTSSKISQKSSSKRHFGKRDTSHKRRKHSTGSNGDKKDGKQSRRSSSRKKRKRTVSESGSSSSNGKAKYASQRRKSNSSCSVSQTRSQKQGEEKTNNSKNLTKLVRSQAAKTKKEYPQFAQPDNNSCTSEMSFRSRSSATSYATHKDYSTQSGQNRFPSTSQEKEQVQPSPNLCKPKPEKSSQSLEELESFLASLKAGKNSKQSMKKDKK